MIRVRDGKNSRLILRVKEPGPDEKSSVDHCLRGLRRTRQISSWTWRDEGLFGANVASPPYEAAALGALELAESLHLIPNATEIDFNFLLNFIPHLLNSIGIATYKPPYFIGLWKGSSSLKTRYTREELESATDAVQELIQSRYADYPDKSAFLERFLHVFFNCLCIGLEDEEVFQHWMMYWNWLELAASSKGTLPES